MSSSLLSIFPAGLIPWRGADGFDRRSDGTRADGVLDRGRRRLISFCSFARRRRRATKSIAVGTGRRLPVQFVTGTTEPFERLYSIACDFLREAQQGGI
jgi:hypothetical protein